MDADVIVAGAGPVGLMLAAELRLHGVRVIVAERLAEPGGFSKAGALHARTVETFALRGLVPRLREQARAGILRMFFDNDPELARRVAGDTGHKVDRQHFAGIRTLRVDELASPYAGVFPILQADTEAVLAERAAGLGADIRRGYELAGLEPDASGVTALVRTPAGPTRLRAAYLVGCDGGRSTVRRTAGFGFPGDDPTYTGRLGDIRVPELLADPGIGHHRTPGGYLLVAAGRVMTMEFGGPPVEADRPMTVEELAGSVRRVAGRPVEIPGTPEWMSRFTDVTRMADAYRRGRVLLAGDAAHVHSPSGGQGLSLGLQDAVNLGWKLAAVVRGGAPCELLDTYGAERRPVAARVLHNTRAQTALMNPGPGVTPLRELFAELMEFPDVNRYLAEMITGLDLRYDLGGGHPLTGGFLPAFDITGPDGAAPVYGLFRTGRWVLLDLGAGIGAGPEWPEVDVVTAPPVPEVAASALLVRPDGYVAWACSPGDDPGPVRAVLDRWCAPGPGADHALG
ncbi:MAG TPA: FAD-dependent monooxygenase [Streptosporangiaceae bacterium]|jgi:2-polyprenyl-6-methoxyphenol hydroxylase-like FAD-dependent oxidoreductase